MAVHTVQNPARVISSLSENNDRYLFMCSCPCEQHLELWKTKGLQCSYNYSSLCIPSFPWNNLPSKWWWLLLNDWIFLNSDMLLSFLLWLVLWFSSLSSLLPLPVLFSCSSEGRGWAHIRQACSWFLNQSSYHPQPSHAFQVVDSAVLQSLN